jgi:hypothetical protein
MIRKIDGVKKMNNIKIKINFALLLVAGFFSYCAEAMEYGISVNKNDKNIILYGENNPCKARFDNGQVVELESFRSEITFFPWEKFAYKEYVVILDGVNIHTGISTRCLLWFINSGFKVQLNPTSYISLEALEDFIRIAPKRNLSTFADLICLQRFPMQQGYNGYARSEDVATLLSEKGYTFSPKI